MEPLVGKTNLCFAVVNNVLTALPLHVAALPVRRKGVSKLAY